MNDVIEIFHGPLVAQVLPTGATLSRLRYYERDLILGFLDPKEHMAVPIYAGAIVGPIANRISAGRVNTGSDTYQMQLNENKETALHSGSDGLHAQRWSITKQHSNSVTLQCILPHGACGLPGTRTISAQYTLDAAGLILTILARSDHETPINIAHHPYWALEQDQSQIHLQIAAKTYLPVDAKGLPLGTVAPVTDTPFDFRTLKPVGLSSRLDHNFCLSQERRKTPKFAARLVASDGLTLDIETTEPGLQVYAGAGLPSLPSSATFGTKSQPNAAIALEPQGWPDAPNQNNFPSIFINVGETYHQVTRYRISSRT